MPPRTRTSTGPATAGGGTPPRQVRNTWPYPLIVPHLGVEVPHLGVVDDPDNLLTEPPWELVTADPAASAAPAEES